MNVFAGRSDAGRTLSARAGRLGLRVRLVLVIGVLITSFLATQAGASVFNADFAWTPDPTTGVTRIKICIIGGSTTYESFFGSSLYSTPSLAQVVARVRDAVNNTWGRASSVWFDGWEPCSQVTNPAEYVGLLIHPTAPNQAQNGILGLGRVSFSNPGIQIKPWGNANDFLGLGTGGYCFDYFDGYSFDCVEQYAIHEFGHTLGFEHEWRNPLRPVACTSPPAGESVLPPGSWSTTYSPGQFQSWFMVDDSVYDANSMMVYGENCAQVTGVRFGSPTPSASDLAAVAAVYGPPSVTPIFVTSPYFWTPWYDALGSLPRRVFETSAENIALANEVAAPPVANQALGTPLTWLATTAGLCSSVTLNALQRPCTYPITYQDTEGGTPFGPGTLSIGDITDCEDDDFELSFAPDTVRAFAFTLVDNTVEGGESIRVYGGDVELGNFAPPAFGPDGKVFIGFASDTAITSIRFDEGSGDDDIAIRDFELGCTGTTSIAYPDLPFNPIAINAATTCASPIVRTIHVPDSFEIGEVRLAFNASHTYRGDIQATLISPSGTPVTVISSSNDSLDNYDLILDGALDSGLLNSGVNDDPAAPYFSRRVQPSNPLTAFVGENAVGDWQLQICDVYSALDNGTYNRAQLILEPAAEIVVTTTLDIVDDTDGQTSLREAMMVAEATAGTVTFAPSLANATVSISTASSTVSPGLGATAFNIESAVVIDGKDAPGLTLAIATPMRFAFVSRTGSLTLRNLTLSGGQAVQGAVAWVDRGRLTVERATIRNNTASSVGGVVFSNEGIVDFIDSTLSGNHAGSSGGVVFHAGTAAFYADSTTFTGNTAGSNGGAISNAFGLVQLTNSLVAGNTPGDLSGTASGSSHHNLIGDPATAGGLVHGVNNNLLGDGLGGALPIAEILDPFLASNGGLTQTHALPPGSPALDAGLTDRIEDQRGVARPQGPAADIGAFEVENLLVSNANDAGAGSLRNAIGSGQGSSRIVFDAALDGATIALTGGEIQVWKNLDIDASDLPSGLTLTGSGLSRVFRILGGRSVALEGLTLTDATAYDGGAIFNAGRLTIRSSTLSGNTSFVAAAIWNAATADLTLINSTISGNEASFNGGAILNEQGSVTLIHATIAGNTAYNYGGGIDNSGGSVHLENSIVADNTGPRNGADLGNRDGGVVSSSGANLVGDHDTIATEFPVGPLVGTRAAPMDPQLLTLGDYGGSTHTRHPLVGSPVIDAAIATVDSPAVDQRGQSRPGTLDDDLGAVEVPEPGLLIQLVIGAVALASLRRRQPARSAGR